MPIDNVRSVTALPFQNPKGDQAMRIKTLRRIVTATGSVRLVQRETSKPFVVINDVPHRHVVFDAYTQFAEAAARFSSLSGQTRPLSDQLLGMAPR
jgi:hypothetical protein